MLLKDKECHYVNSLNDSDQCNFVKNASDCQNNESYINYIQFLYCSFGSGEIKGPFIIMVVWVIIMFICLGVTADDFLCPALVVISKTLGLSQNVAGVTFLAIGNGAPDIFSSLAGIQQQRPQLVIGALFGAGIFVTTVVAGSICLSREFSTKRFSFLKDMVFYLGATYWTFYLFSKKEITLTDAIGFLVLYVIYITIVIVGQIIYQKLKKRQRANAIINQEEVSSVASIQDELDNRQPGVSFSFPSHVDENQRSHSLVGSHLEHFISQVVNTPQTSKECENTEGSVATREAVDCVPRVLLTNSMEISPWKDFLLHLSPFEIQEWKSKSWFFRIFEIVKAPVYLILTVTTPVVDYKNSRDNWCRYLNVLQSFTSPMVIFTATGKFSVVFGNVFPLWVLMTLISLLLAILVFITSSNHTPPVYHWIFGYVGFGVSVTWIYTLANEIVSLLQAAGILMNLSDAILGLTVLAWGNSLGDLVSNMSVARMGFPQMGFSACVGGPLLNLLLGFGLSYTLTLAEARHSVKVQFTRQIELLYGTLTTSLVSTFIILPLFKFRVKHMYGVYLLLIYLVFIILAILMELHIV